jgi:glycerophosphoryl diester phosphodiesterase
MPSDGSLISAHRGGPGPDASRENTLPAMVEAATLDCEYVEFDIQRCRGGVHVLYHDDVVLDGDRRLPIRTLTFEQFAALADTYLLLDQALEIFRDRKKVHLDLKFLSDPEDGGDDGDGHEVALVAHVIDVMGAENLIVTTLEDDSVRAVRAWSRDRYPGLLVGLSLGRDVAGLGLWDATRVRLSELFPGRRLRRCDANLVVCEQTLARLRIAGWAQRHGMPLLVWTVDSPRELRRWLRDRRAWLVTTNYPRRALALRRELAAGSSG